MAIFSKIINLQALDRNAILDLKSEYKSTSIKPVIRLLNKELVGLIPVKSRINEIASLLILEKLRKKSDLTSNSPGLHMSFTGNPGTGKTTVALRMSSILYKLGYCRKGHLTTVTRDDLVGQYIGHTAPKTKEVLKKSMGGILFIDEAYYLYKPDNERDYGSEAIEILLQVMENQRDDLIIILAGYKERMDRFYESNPGLSSRISNHVDFPDYSTSELLIIGKTMLQSQQYRITLESEEKLTSYIQVRKYKQNFANARNISNVLDRIRMRQANRTFNSEGINLTKSNLATLSLEDWQFNPILLNSTLFFYYPII